MSTFVITKGGVVDVWIGREANGVPSTTKLGSFPWSGGAEIYYTLNSTGHFSIGNKSSNQKYLQGYLLGNFPLAYVAGLGEPDTVIAGFVSIEISEPASPTISYRLIIQVIHVISAISIIVLLLGIFTQLRRSRKIGNKTVVACFLSIILLISSSLLWARQNFGQQYFFFQDADFWNDSDALMVKWLGRTWNFSVLGNGNYANITSGMAWLRFNESSGQNWGGAILLQGYHPHGRGNWYELLGGTSSDEASPVNGVTFYNGSEIPEGKFLLYTKVMLLERQYTTLVVNITKEKSELPVGNVGVDLMFSYEYRDDNNKLRLSTYDDKDPGKGGAIHADVLFSRFSYDNTGTLMHTPIGPEGDSVNDSPYDGDCHISLVRSQIEDVDTWYELEVDIGKVVDRIFELLLERKGIKIVSITAQGA
ncbi:MAG: hypothetical protein KKB37_17445 [Alphaproteobacteria bacterium]|nr:hypothetical protein [Alphaproteobacteria bacterium]